MPSATAIKLNRHSGRDCRNPEAMEGKLVAEQVFDSGNLQPAVSPPCGLDSGNPCRNDGIYGPSGLVYNVKCWSVGKIANKGNPPLQKGGRGDFLGRLIPTCLILLALLLFVPAALAQTPISGAITSNAHWTVADGPYLVSSDVSIQNGAVLTIDPGATIYMGANASLTIQAGSIQAIGTAAKTIQVLSDKTRQGLNAALGDWKQWVFGPGTINTRLDYVEFAFGSGLAVQGSAPVFNYLNLHDHLGAAMSVDLAASPTGVGNQATNNTVNGISVPAGDIIGNIKWGLVGIPYVVSTGVVSVGVSPVIQSVTPNTVEQGQSLSLTVNGIRLDGATGSFDRAGLTLTPTGNRGSQATFQLTASANAVPGSSNLQLQTNAGLVQYANAITVTPMMPSITTIAPATVLADAGSTAITVTGLNFLGSSQVLFNAASVPTQLVSATQLIATLPNQTVPGTLQTQVSFPDPLNPGQYRLSNTVPLTVQVPVPPTVSIVPTPIALPPDNQPHNITVSLSKADYRDNTLAFSISDTTKATVTPASVTIPAGQTATQITLLPTQTGTVNLSVTSATLQGISVPLFITADFVGANTSYAAPVGVVVASNTGPATRQTSATSSPVGITVGPVLTALSRSGWIVGDNPTLTVYGQGIPSMAQVSLMPGDGITAGPVDIGTDGSQLQVSFNTAPDAVLGPHKLVVKGADGKDIPFVDPAKAVVQIMAGMPSIDSIAPILATPGTRVNLTVRGRYLNQGVLSLLPASGIRIDAVQSISVDGTTLTVILDIAADAPTGSRIIQVTTPAGATPGNFTSANTFTVVNTLNASATQIATPLVGVMVGDNTPPPVTQQYEATSALVGVLLGSGIGNVNPSVGVIGSTTTVTVQGAGLQGVTSVALVPPDGVTVGSPNSNADGTELTVNLQIDPATALGVRRLVVNSSSGQMTFLQPSASQFLISAPMAELDSVVPQVLLAGQPSTAITLRGRNLLNVTGVRLDPPQDISVTGLPIGNADGTAMNFAATVAAGAASGTRTVIVTTAAGDSSTVQQPGNSVRIANQLGATYANIATPLVGVTVGNAAPEPVSVASTLASNVIGVVVDSPPVTHTATRTAASARVGVILGAAAQSINPDGWLQGATGEMIITGLGLDTITTATVIPATGVSLGTPVSSLEGTRLAVPITVAADAPLISRRLRLYASDNAELDFTNPAAALFGIGSLPTLTSVSPIILQQGKSATLTVRGSNLQGVTSVIFDPPQGLTATAGLTWSQDGFGELLTVPVNVDAAAPLGSKVVELHVSGGATSATSTPANTVKVVVPQ